MKRAQLKARKVVDVENLLRSEWSMNNGASISSRGLRKFKVT